ncbi:hypothetical protein Q5O14_11125 [Eubacteriaceae bacterium ES2]|nr:hypothetical protein Q5O14_11125 [Eubacteriaceae bacterium ES2]
MVNMNSREIERLIKTTDVEVIPPKGLKEKLLYKVIPLEHKTELVLTSVESFFFEKPLKAACLISIPISGALWVVLGSSFAQLLCSVIR